VGALPGRMVFKEDQGTDEFIPPLDLIDKAQLKLRKVTGRFYESSFTQAYLVLREARMGGAFDRPERGVP
jgi:hypothetical protein